MLWHIGNTTVRTPYRLRSALIALQGSPLNGNIIGDSNETQFAKLLHTSSVVNVQRIEDGDGEDFSDLGRKWRSALSQLGFITHKLSRNTLPGAVDTLLVSAAARIPQLSGRPFEITPNGYRLINAEVTTGQQECFLRSLLAYTIPSQIETGYKCSPFSPLKYIIDVLYNIEQEGKGKHLSFEEYALFVQTSSPDNGIEAVVNQILDFRERRIANAGHVRAFDRDEYKKAVGRNFKDVKPDKIDTKAATYDDYADLTFRYLKATGLFKSKGRGITISPVKEELVQLIFESKEPQLFNDDYLVNLWNGSKLPTDDAPAALKVAKDLVEKVKIKGGTVQPILEGDDISQKRYALEQQLNELEELDYYKNQAIQTDEILAWMNALAGKPSGNGVSVKVPRGEGPAYFEWTIWRAFLAINSLENQPWEARRFQIDQDFLPIGTAPGRGPDMVFEFHDCIIVVEVTLTSSSRQEAAEGESVRRHVADYAEREGRNGKTVYGLFLAIDIDTNTAHTYRTGEWYLKGDRKISLQIVPVRLDDFSKLFEKGSEKLDGMLEIIKCLLKDARSNAAQDAPVWKESISHLIEDNIRRM